MAPWNDPSRLETVLDLSIIALLGASLFIFFLFTSRLVKGGRVRRKTKLRERFQNSINVIVELDSSHDAKPAAYQFHYSDLQKDMGRSNLAKQVMVDQLVGLKRNLSGSSANTLIKVYLRLGLDQFSLRKLNSYRSKRKAQGITELSQMEVPSATKRIKSMLRSSNRTVREEALIGLVRLDRDMSLDFLDDYTSRLSSWVVMRIHRQLSFSDKRHLPDFSRWYRHVNADVVLFAIEMTRQFRQINNASKLAELFNDANQRIATLAIEVCGDLHSVEVADHLIQLVKRDWSNDIVSLSLVKSLGKIAQNDLHWQALTDYINHPNYAVKFEAVRALYFSEHESKYLQRWPVPSTPDLDAILRHVKDPLLQS